MLPLKVWEQLMDQASENVQQRANTNNDRCVRQSWHEWEIHEGARKVILCLETHLELRPGYDCFDKALLETLINESTDLLRASESPVDGIRIVPARWML